MKKALLLFSILAIAHLQLQAQKKPSLIPLAEKDTLISLNGIGYNDAMGMIKNTFNNRAQDISPTRQSIWIDIGTLKKMVRLIANHNAKATTKKDSIDGVRIYFASDTNKKRGKLKTSIILVTTTYDGPAYDGRASKACHMDYYQLNWNDSLFQTSKQTTLMGKKYHKLIYRRGDRLYSRCTTCTRDTTCPQREIHYTDRSTAEAMVQHFGSGPILTNSEWFDRELIETFAEDTKDNLDGLRIYFAKHEATDSSNVANEDAFMLVPTIKVNSFLFFSLHRDIFNCNITKAYFEKFQKEKGNGFVSPGGQDNGELCPSHCD